MYFIFFFGGGGDFHFIQFAAGATGCIGGAAAWCACAFAGDDGIVVVVVVVVFDAVLTSVGGCEFGAGAASHGTAGLALCGLAREGWEDFEARGGDAILRVCGSASD